MAAGERRRGRRDNGLDATDWRAVDDLDPRVSEPVLDLLAEQGIAAYVQPAVDVDPVTRSTTLPSRPRDRLYVDRQAVPAARESLRRFFAASGSPGGALEAVSTAPAAPAGTAPASSGPGADPVDVDVDAAFADIVARLDNLAADPTAEPLSSPDALADPGADRPLDAPRRPGPVDGRHVTEPSLLDGLDAFGADLPDLPEDDAEQFVPPPPPPLPRLSRQAVLGGLGILAGLVLVIGHPDLLPLDRSSAMLLGFAAMLGGATALILRLRSGTDPDDTHPDDGAQV